MWDRKAFLKCFSNNKSHFQRSPQITRPSPILKCNKDDYSAKTLINILLLVFSTFIREDNNAVDGSVEFTTFKVPETLNCSLETVKYQHSSPLELWGISSETLYSTQKGVSSEEERTFVITVYYLFTPCICAEMEREVIPKSTENNCAACWATIGSDCGKLHKMIVPWWTQRLECRKMSELKEKWRKIQKTDPPWKWE